MSKQEPKDAPSNLEPGNLTMAYAGGCHGWGGCHGQACLAACRPSRNHCERLKMFLEQSGWSGVGPKLTPESSLA